MRDRIQRRNLTSGFIFSKWISTNNQRFKAMQWINCSMFATFIRVEVFFCPQCKFVSYLGVCGLIIRRRLSAAIDDYGDDHDHDDVEDDVDYGDDDHDDGDATMTTATATAMTTTTATTTTLIMIVYLFKWAEMVHGRGFMQHWHYFCLKYHYVSYFHILRSISQEQTYLEKIYWNHFLTLH